MAKKRAAGRRSQRQNITRHVSPETRIKMQRAAKERRRGPKGSAYGGRFIDSVNKSDPRKARKSLFASDDDGLKGRAWGPETEAGGGGKKGIRRGQRMGGESSQTKANEIAHTNRSELYAQNLKDGQSAKRAKESAEREAASIAYGQTGTRPQWEVVNARYGGEPRRVPQKSVDDLMRETTGGVSSASPRTRSIVQAVGKLDPVTQKELGDEHSPLRQQLAGDLAKSTTRESPYYSGRGERDRVLRFAQAKSEGVSREEALTAAYGRRGRKPSGTAQTSDLVAGGLTRGDIEKQVNYRKKGGQQAGRASKTESLKPTAKGFGFGIEGPAVRTVSQIERRHPDLNKQDVVKVQQAERELIYHQFLANQKWAHETRSAKLKGGQAARENPDRVTFFTTSIGAPSVSVPSDSLVGQYVIGKRRKMAKREHLATKPQLRGQFPEAVRDLHLFEASTGISVGTEGRAGVYKKSGWRTPKAKSPGYGKPVPVGSTIIRDSSGAPIYDTQGNIRFTEGATRPYEIGTKRDVGFRVFLG